MKIATIDWISTDIKKKPIGSTAMYYLVLLSKLIFQLLLDKYGEYITYIKWQPIKENVIVWIQ